MILTSLLFIPIRGGVGVAPTNIGMAYFSDKAQLNHAAVNPLFSLMESAGREQNFKDMFQDLPEEEASMLFAQMQDCGSNTSKNTGSDKSITTGYSSANASANASVKLLKTSRPHIILIVMESFSTSFTQAAANTSNTTPCIDSITNKGLLFSRFYANSFRTDRGLISILGGYPSMPTSSLMKYPRKTQALPSLPAKLHKAGYENTYYYGGNINFTNMNSYLASCLFSTVICDRDFPSSMRSTKWGVNDGNLMDKVKTDWKDRDFSKPTFTVVQTSSSHEPFEVPFSRIKDNAALNAISYTDSCIGDLVTFIANSDIYNNTLIVFVSDHAMKYPEQMSNYDTARFHIPLIFLGGALQKKGVIDTYSSQMDIAATILSALNIPHTEFKFSKNILSDKSPHFAYFSHPGLWGFIDNDGALVYDYNLNETTTSRGQNTEKTKKKGMALLQVLYKTVSKL